MTPEQEAVIKLADALELLIPLMVGKTMRDQHVEALTTVRDFIGRVRESQENV